MRIFNLLSAVAGNGAAANPNALNVWLDRLYVKIWSAMVNVILVAVALVKSNSACMSTDLATTPASKLVDERVWGPQYRDES